MNTVSVVRPAQARVYEYLQSCGRNGATDDEMQAALGLLPSTQRFRRLELMSKSRIVRNGQWRKTRKGNLAAVWVTVANLLPPEVKEQPKVEEKKEWSPPQAEPTPQFHNEAGTTIGIMLTVPMAGQLWTEGKGVTYAGKQMYLYNGRLYHVTDGGDVVAILYKGEKEVKCG